MRHEVGDAEDQAVMEAEKIQGLASSLFKIKPNDWGAEEQYACYKDSAHTSTKHGCKHIDTNEKCCFRRFEGAVKKTTCKLTCSKERIRKKPFKYMVITFAKLQRKKRNTNRGEVGLVQPLLVTLAVLELADYSKTFTNQC